MELANHGVTAEAHVMAHIRERLAQWKVMTTVEAQQQEPGTRVTVAGLNIRPHRLQRVAAGQFFFPAVEDEFGWVQASTWRCARSLHPGFSLSPDSHRARIIERRRKWCVAPG